MIYKCSPFEPKYLTLFFKNLKIRAAYHEFNKIINSKTKGFAKNIPEAFINHFNEFGKSKQPKGVKLVFHNTF